MITHGAFNATLIVLAQRDYGWSKSEYSYHLSIAAAFAVIGAGLGLWKHFANWSVGSKLAVCNILVALSYGMILYYKTFPLASLWFGICNTAAVVIMVVNKTKVQMFASCVYPESLTSILAARSIVIKAATLLGTGACLILDRYLGLEITLWFLIIPLAFAFWPIMDEIKISLARPIRLLFLKQMNGIETERQR